MLPRVEPTVMHRDSCVWRGRRLRGNRRRKHEERKDRKGGEKICVWKVKAKHLSSPSRTITLPLSKAVYARLLQCGCSVSKSASWEWKWCLVKCSWINKVRKRREKSPAVTEQLHWTYKHNTNKLPCSRTSLMEIVEAVKTCLIYSHLRIWIFR